MDDQTEKLIANLEATKGVLFRDGWCQNTIKDDEGHRCIVGAMIHVGTMGYEGYCQALDAMEAAIPADFGVKDIVGWNNERGRTFEEIIAGIDAAIVKVKEMADV